MTTNEIIKEIAVYDGYTHKETVTGDGVFYAKNTEYE
jgi:hypothetical protein